MFKVTNLIRCTQDFYVDARLRLHNILIAYENSYVYTIGIHEKYWKDYVSTNVDKCYLYFLKKDNRIC